MDQREAEAKAREGYDRMAQVYADHVIKELSVPSLVRSGLEFFAHQVRQLDVAPVADVGCGPGHVTAFLDELGLDVFGIDISPALLDIARAAHPDIRFEEGELASMPVADGSLRAIVARHSLIHTPAELVPLVFDEFARALAPDGLLWLSFFAAERPDTHGRGFDHAVTTAYELDVGLMAEQLTAAGFVEDIRIVRQPTEHERQLPHGILFARRSSDPDGERA